MQRGFQFLPRLEVVALQDVLNPAVKSLDHAVGLRRHRWRQAVVDIQNRAKLVELMFAGLGAFAQAKEAVGELFSVSVRMVRMRSGQALSRSRRKRRALAADLLL